MALDLYYARTIIGVIKLQRIRWAEYVGRIGEKTDAWKVLLWNLKEETGVILKRILKKQDRKMWTEFI
jgi:hypothetical protein